MRHSVKGHIHVAADNPVIREFAGEAMEHAGDGIQPFSNAQRYIKHLQARRFIKAAIRFDDIKFSYLNRAMLRNDPLCQS